jgi:cytochrome c oxidase cbb3-type subunit 2
MANNSSNTNTGSKLSHEKIETNNFLMIVLILLVLLVGGAVEIVPLFFQKSTTEPIKGIQPYISVKAATTAIHR